MKIQLLTALTVLALSVTTAQAGRSGGHKSGTDLTNNSKNALAIGGKASASSSYRGKNGGKDTLDGTGGRAIAGSIYLTGGACACDFDDVKNRSKNAIAVGNATAGSIHVSTMARGYK